MNPNSVRPRRLHVSALAAVANPSYTRLDTWNLLDDACRHLAEVDLAGLDTTHDVARAKRLMDRIGAYERYWLYPGAQNLATFRAHLDSHSTVRLTEEVSLAVRLLSEYGDRTALFDTSASLAEQELVAQAKQQQFYTVLLADDSPATAPDSLAECLRQLRNPADEVQFELLVVASIEDAITAVALNGEIQAAIIRHDLPLRSRDRVPLMTTLLGTDGDEAVANETHDWVECAEWIRELRPHIDLYLLTDESIAAETQDEPDVYDRTFYRLNDVTDLHSTVLAGLRNRYATPFFDALRAYAAAPVGQFHALPVARGASIFNSKSLHDMGELPREDPDGAIRHPDQQNVYQQRVADLHDRRHLVERALSARCVASGGDRSGPQPEGGQRGRPCSTPTPRRGDHAGSAASTRFQRVRPCLPPRRRQLFR